MSRAVAETETYRHDKSMGGPQSHESAVGRSRLTVSRWVDLGMGGGGTRARGGGGGGGGGGGDDANETQRTSMYAPTPDDNATQRTSAFTPAVLMGSTGSRAVASSSSSARPSPDPDEVTASTAASTVTSDDDGGDNDGDGDDGRSPPPEAASDDRGDDGDGDGGDGDGHGDGHGDESRAEDVGGDAEAALAPTPAPNPSIGQAPEGDGGDPSSNSADDGEGIQEEFGSREEEALEEGEQWGQQGTEHDDDDGQGQEDAMHLVAERLGGRDEESPLEMCGVPVALPVPAEGEEDEDEDEDDKVADVVDGDAQSADEEEGLAASPNVVPSRLNYLGHEVVLASPFAGESASDDGDVDVESLLLSPAVDIRALEDQPLPPEDLEDAMGEEGSPPPKETWDIVPSSSKDGGRAALWGRRWWAAALGALVVGVGIATSALLKNRRGGDEGGPEAAADLEMVENVFESITPDPTLMYVPASDREELVLLLLDPFLSTIDPAAHKIKGSPQNRAIEWLTATSFGAYGDFDLRPWVDPDDQGIEGPTSLPPEQQDRLVQRYILAVLYFSTGGVSMLPPGEEDGGEVGSPQSSAEGWIDDSNFLSREHECSWKSSQRPDLGVTCDPGTDHVESITLMENGLVGTLPQNELHGLPRLGVLDVSHNRFLRGPLPEDLGLLPDLRALLLGHNSFTGTFPSSYANLTNLQDIDLEHNNLRGSIPPYVGNMTSLSNILLNQNQFTGGMDNFCNDDIVIKMFYSDCYCRSFPKLDAEVACTCCTICCEGVGTQATCHLNAGCYR